MNSNGLVNFMLIKLVLRIIDVKLKLDLEMYMYVFYLILYLSIIYSVLNLILWEK